MDLFFLIALAKYFPPVVVILFLPILGIKKKNKTVASSEPGRKEDQDIAITFIKKKSLQTFELKYWE